MFYKKWYAVTIRSAQVARGREKVENHRVFSDAAKYLLAASVTLKSLSVSKLFHMTCLEHFAQLLLYESQISLSVAYAGFSKGGPGNLKVMKTKRKISPLRINFPAQKSGEDQKKGLHSKLVLFLAEN